MDLRGQAALLTAELVVLVVVAALPLPIPAQVPLLAMALISYGIRRQVWADRFASDGFRWAVGAATGAIALGLALAVAPVLETRTGGLVVWSNHGMVRGKLEMFVSFALIVAALAVATELVMRGWIFERLREQLPGRVGVAIAVAGTAAVEAIFTGAPGWGYAGAALVSAALGGLYLAAGRSLVAPIAARLAFELGALALEGLQLVD
jgi:membrane protease YdiL (CAAX protease family)